MSIKKIGSICISAFLCAFLFSSCIFSSKLPEGQSFNYEVGEVVYYKVDHMPMLIEKQIVKKGSKLYKVVFKNAEGELMMNVVEESELLSTPPVNRAKI